MEVDVRKDMRLGTEWSVAGKTSVSGKNAAVGGSFNRGVPNSNLPGLVTGTLPSGFSMGVFTEAITIGGVSFNNLAAMINAFQEDSNVNILQTPQILTTENEEAKINVGKNVPYQTSVSTSNNDTFNQFEYRDVGTIKSTVVIGGLIDSTRTDVEEKVPLLGDIPLLGWLFKYRSERNEKQNLFVFLTPHVIKNPEEAEKVYGRKKIQMDSLKEGKVKLFKKKQSDADIESESKPPM
jgi:general secretion pathway protein D